MKYSQERKQAVLARLAPPHQRTVKDVAAEEGISPATLCHWRQQARLTGGLFPDDGADPEGWTARDKFTAVMETAPLNESACPARSRRALSTAKSAGFIPSGSPPGERPVSPRRTGLVRGRQQAAVDCEVRREARSLKRELRREAICRLSLSGWDIHKKMLFLDGHAL